MPDRSNETLVHSEFVVEGAALSYADVAAARPATLTADAILLIHGWGCSSEDWSEFIGPFAHLGRVVVFDLPGHGRSANSADGVYTPESIAAIAVALLDHLSISKVIAIGHSAGADIAASLAVRYPDRGQAAVFVEPTFGTPIFETERLAQSAKQFDEGDPIEVLVSYFQRFTEPPELAARHLRTALGSRQEVARRMFKGFAFGPESFRFLPATVEFLSRRVAPALGVYSSESRAEIASSFLDRPGDEVLTYPAMGHWPHQEFPGRFVADVTAWLRGGGLLESWPE